MNLSRTTKRLIAAAAAVGLLAIGAGCSVATTESTQQAIRYSGGATDVEKFKECQTGPNREYGDPGDHVYYYPAAQRTFSFNDAKGSKPDTGPISVTTEDTQQLTIRGYFAFTLTTDCKKLKSFHEKIGKRMGADFQEGQQEDAGWSAFLAQYFNIPVNSIADAVGLQYNWLELYSNATVQQQFETQMTKQLGAAINRQVGEGVITIVGSDIQRPEPSKELAASLAKKAQAKADGDAQVEEVTQQRRVQQQKTALAKDANATRAQCVRYYTAQQCMVLELADGGKIPFYPIPAGGSVNVSPSTK